MYEKAKIMATGQSIKMPAKQQREIFSFVVFGKRDIRYFPETGQWYTSCSSGMTGDRSQVILSDNELTELIDMECTVSEAYF